MAFSPSTVAVCAAGLLGPWVDERFLLILPAVACLRWRLRPSRGWVLALSLSLAPYLLVRLAALLNGDPSVSSHLALLGPALARYVSFVPVGWWFGWRAAWAPSSPPWSPWRAGAPRPGGGGSWAPRWRRGWARSPS